MRNLNKNKQTLYYAEQIGSVPIYELDKNGNKILDYTDEEGNKYYRETGEYEPLYGPATPFEGNIAMSGGESKVAEFGIDVSDYDAILILDRGIAPLTETCRIWYESEVIYKDSDENNADGNSADYRVLKPNPSLNSEKYILGRILK